MRSNDEPDSQYEVNMFDGDKIRRPKTMNKVVVLINGKGGVGKDTICSIVAKHYTTINRSSIAPVKAAAKLLGWLNNDKSDKGRKFLSDIKMLSTEYNDYPFKCMLHDCESFVANPFAEVMFVHIREPKEIDRLKRSVASCCACKTLLIRSNRIKDTFGNIADDEVENYVYDYIYQNDKPLEDVADDFMPLFRRYIMEES